MKKNILPCYIILSFSYLLPLFSFLCLLQYCFCVFLDLFFLFLCISLNSSFSKLDGKAEFIDKEVGNDVSSVFDVKLLWIQSMMKFSIPHLVYRTWMCIQWACLIVLGCLCILCWGVVTMFYYLSLDVCASWYVIILFGDSFLICFV